MKGIEEQARKRFVKEAKYQQQIEHPNIVKIIDVDTDKEPPFYTMPVADASLEEVPGIKNRGIKKCKAKDNQIIIHFSSVPLF